MKGRYLAFYVAAALALVGFISVGLRYHLRRQQQLDSGDTLWRITYRAKFKATRAGARVRLAIPRDTDHARIFRQDVVYLGLSGQRLRSSREFPRELSLAARRRGPHSLTARFDVHVSPAAHWRSSDSEADLNLPEAYLGPAAGLPADDPLVRATLERLQGEVAGTTNFAERIYRFCTHELDGSRDVAPHDALSILRQRAGSPLGRARTMATLCRAANIPARMVAGFCMEASGEVPAQFWAEVFDGVQWAAYGPANGFAGHLPHNFMPVQRDGLDLIRGSDVADLETAYTVAPLAPGDRTGRFGHRGVSSMLNLTRLPLEMHEALSIILLMPLGALVTALFRTVIGLRTFGTFTPSLLALSFVYADWRTGLLTFTVVLVVGLTSRHWLDRLKLLMVPRLSVILTIVVCLITFTVSVLDYFNLTPSAQAEILPMVILTMTVERFYLTSEEDSPGFALQLLAATVLVGACCYGVLRWRSVGQLVFTYPEVHFFTIAALILLGRYSGYRLTELWRFRDLAGPKP